MKAKAVRAQLFPFIMLAIASSSSVAALAREQAPPCGGCYPDGQPCTLTYGAAGTVRDSATGDPVAGAVITVLDLSTVSAADGSYEVSGTRPEQCHLDYYWSISASADGYEPLAGGYYATATFPTNLELRLDPKVPATEFPVSGFVAEFPPCSGRMRGVTVTLEPLGLATQTSLGPDGGLFSFEAVPPGEYTLVVTPPCNLFGCWNATRVVVVDEFVRADICMDGWTPTPAPTPTWTPTPKPSGCPLPTPPLCPVGQAPACIVAECLTGCECKPCEPCPPGRVYSGAVNHCDCVSVPPTPTNTPCPGPTFTPCPLGKRPRYCAPEVCNAGCGCEACPSCPAGTLLASDYNSCRCVADPAYTPPTARPTPTPDVCPVRPTRCPVGERPRPCDDPCGLHCGCETCPPCGQGEVPAHGGSSCSCIREASRECVGDCDGDNAVSVSELVLMVSVAVGRTTFAPCLTGDLAGAAVQVNEILAAVYSALHGCALPPPETPEPVEVGVCYESSDCFPCDVYPCRPFAASRDFCCSLTRSATFSWCPADLFDPPSNECAGCEYPCRQ